MILIAYHLLESSIGAYIEWLVNEPMFTANKIEHKDTLLVMLPADAINPQVKALVWFWLIDETLSANLVYQSNHEIGSTTPSDKANEDHDMMMVMAW